MGHRPTGKPVGHPILPIDWDKVDKYLQTGCSGAQVAAAVGVSSDTLYRRCQSERGANFSAILQENRAKGESMLHAKQFSEAMKGDRGMLIWLGKQRLGQKNCHEIKADVPVNLTIVNYGDDPSPKPWSQQNPQKG